MLDVKFSYNNNIFKIPHYENYPLGYALLNIANYINKNINFLNYFINLKNVKSECTFKDMKSHMNNEEINILVEDYRYIEQKIKSEFIICPYCLSFPKFKFENYKISLTDCNCSNKEQFNNISLDEFEETQKIFPNNKYLIQDQLNCQIHKNENDLFCSYCTNCKKDLCAQCRSEHYNFKNHNIISSFNIPNKNKLIAKHKILEETIDETNKTIEEYINKLKIVNESLKALKKMVHDIGHNYDPQKRNFIILNNINNFRYDFVLNDLNNINNDKDIKSKFNKIIELYEKIVFLDEINITYDLNEENIKSNKIKIFGEKFVENNKNNCKIIYKDKPYDLSVFFNINKNNDANENQFNENILSIKLKMDINKITNLSNMFNQCIQLKSFSDISKINTINITDISNMFYGCSQLISLPDISKWNVSNVTNMEGLFQGCISLKSLPDISKWNTSKVKNMNNLFNGCVELRDINIFVWDVSNVEEKDDIFKECLSLNYSTILFNHLFKNK